MLHVQSGSFSPAQAGGGGGWGETPFPTDHTGVWVEGSATHLFPTQAGKRSYRCIHTGDTTPDRTRGVTNHRALKLIPDAFRT